MVAMAAESDRRPSRTTITRWFAPGGVGFSNPLDSGRFEPKSLGLERKHPLIVAVAPDATLPHSGGCVRQEREQRREIEGVDLSGERTAVVDLVRRIMHHRELVVILARKEFFTRYRRASFGLVWAVLLPLVQAMVLALVLSRFVKFRTEVPYVVLVYAGMVPWSFFSQAVTAASTSIVDNSDISSRIYFPRAILPLMTAASGVYGMVAATVVLLVVALFGGVALGPELLLLLPAAVLLVLLTAALGLVLAALHVYFRDVRFLVSAGLMPLLYATPVLYPLERLPSGLRHVVSANPMSAVVQLFRAALGVEVRVREPLIWTGAWTTLLLAAGLLLHARRDRVFSDLL